MSGLGFPFAALLTLGTTIVGGIFGRKKQKAYIPPVQAAPPETTVSVNWNRLTPYLVVGGLLLAGILFSDRKGVDDARARFIS